ncbi:MAG: DUF6471 domain-containing protein [Pseudomonadota bacterium]|nr:DUF6471 domain-containing protein [Pseudomonadota bacterium]
MVRQSKAHWDGLARNVLRGQLVSRGMTYSDLCERLGEIGVVETEGAIKSKLSRGSFTAIFLLQCMMALDVDWLQMPRKRDMMGASPDKEDRG